MDPMFLFVGRLAVQKGPDLLLEVPLPILFTTYTLMIYICILRSIL